MIEIAQIIIRVECREQKKQEKMKRINSMYLFGSAVRIGMVQSR